MTMTSRHLVDPELAPLLDQLAPLPFAQVAIQQLRADLARLRPQMTRAATGGPGITLIERRVPGPAGAPDVRVLIYLPAAAPRPLPALLWLHGGGYVLGSADMDDLKAKAIVAQVGCAVVAVDYRLAPETPHPGPVEDCYAALRWLYRNAAELGVEQRRIAIGGESAGGGLAAALGLLTRDRGQIPLAFQLLIAPMLDDRTVTLADRNPYVGEYVWTSETNRFGWTALLGHAPGAVGVSPYAAAARAEQLAGLPPSFVSVGALDLFLEESLEYGRRLLRAGVPTEIHVYPGAYHGFPAAAEAQVSRANNRDIIHALRRALHRDGPLDGIAE